MPNGLATFSDFFLIFLKKVQFFQEGSKKVAKLEKESKK